MSEAREVAVRYRFEPVQRRGLIAGFRGGQVAAAGAGLAAGLLALRLLPSAAGLAAAIATAVAGLAAATVPLWGRTAEEWAPDAARYLAGRRPPRWSGHLPFASISILGAQLTSSGGLRLLADAPADPRDGEVTMGVVADRARGVFSAVVAVEAPGFLLTGDADRDLRVAGWARVLAAAARDRGAVHRLQWIERAVPDGASNLVAHLGERCRLPGDDPAVASYRDLLGIVAGAALRHGVLLVVSVDAGRVRRAVRSAGGGDRGACAVLAREVAALRRRMADAQIASTSPLDPEALSRVVRAAVEPDRDLAPDAGAAVGRDPVVGADRPMAPGGPTAGEGAGLVPRVRPAWTRRSPWPWPMAVDGRWSRVRTDGTWHAVYWVAQWPRADVPADFLASLVLAPGIRRTVSVVMEPVGPARAARQVEQARTSGIADAELRRRGGFLATARRRREEEGLAAREAELADGNAQYRFCGYVGVTASSAESLDEACGNAEQAAAQSGLELRRCYGDQVRAFLATLPLGTGLA